MSYKNIKSMLHNFGHSFCSLMNYVDGEYIVDLLPKIINNSINNIFTIGFPSRNVDSLTQIPVALKKSVTYWSDHLPKHIASHKIESKKVKEVKMEFSLPNFNSITARYSFECDVICKDDKEREYRIRVNQKS